MSEGPLAGIRILEFGDAIAPAYCGKLLADYGADVIKVEHPRGDHLRAEGPFPRGAAHAEGGALFAFLNTSKKNVTVARETEDGKALVRRLLEQVDVVVHPFGKADREGLGLASSSWTQLVEVAITPCGLDGPYAADVHGPLTMAALGGWMHAMGDPGLPPLYPGGAYISYLAGISGAIGALTALEARKRGSKGQLVDVSEFETAVGTLPFDTLQLSFAGTQRTRSGELYGDNPLAAIYPCADGYVQFQVGFRPREFLRMVGGHELENDPRFQNAELRSANRAALRERIVDWLKGKKRWELFDICAKSRLVFSAVPDVSELTHLPPHLERDFFHTESSASLAGLPLPGPAIRFAQGGWRSEPAHAIGADNVDVLGDSLGLASRLGALRTREVI